ncbi:MAG: hypothetical protein J07HQW1_01861 [Haloquadratum walsbyi J07HQW1]|uniref:Uncharacterized protein n=1 Tax=Haloquadratum walsbyi J07HQW1 TaxID=1238424 RepID=U1PE04_9EURY|nr:MAG: hypothetical protein J07HQW1_01861 [Haloquadratum walsbyi J07HQW1]
MNKSLLYHGSLLSCGGVLVLLGVTGIGTGLSRVLSVPFGVGVILVGGYQWKTMSDPSVELPADWVVWAMTVMTFISIGFITIAVLGV